MYVVLYLPEAGHPEVFGPYATPTIAASALRRISAAAGDPIDVSHSALLATIDVRILDELHRYQLLKIASSSQLDAHADVIRLERDNATVEVELTDAPPPATRLSGY
ncbi:MAG: hypothetical protein ACRDVD_08800 [Acidimicrobiia bacterium]